MSGEQRGDRSGEGPPTYRAESLRRFAGRTVRVRLVDGSFWFGCLRTNLLSERSLNVYLRDPNGEGVTLSIDQIVEIVPTPKRKA